METIILYSNTLVQTDMRKSRVFFDTAKIGLIIDPALI